MTYPEVCYSKIESNAAKKTLQALQKRRQLEENFKQSRMQETYTVIIVAVTNLCWYGGTRPPHSRVETR